MTYNSIKNPYDLLKYMSENIIYGYIDKYNKKHFMPFTLEEEKSWYDDCLVQMGDEVLKTKIGTCYDQVELERKWFEENNYVFKTIFIWLNIDNLKNAPTHTFLIYKSHDKYYWFEHSWGIYRGIHEYNSFKEALEDVKNNHLTFAINEYKIKINSDNYIRSYEYNNMNKNLIIEKYLEYTTKNEIKS